MHNGDQAIDATYHSNVWPALTLPVTLRMFPCCRTRTAVGSAATRTVPCGMWRSLQRSRAVRRVLLWTAISRVLPGFPWNLCCSHPKWQQHCCWRCFRLFQKWVIQAQLKHLKDVWVGIRICIFYNVHWLDALWSSGSENGLSDCVYVYANRPKLLVQFPHFFSNMGPVMSNCARLCFSS